jgi:triacylglycerol lipase
VVAVLPPTLLGPDTDFVPPKAARRGESRAYWDLLRILGPRVRQPAPSAAVPVILVPGFIAGDVSVAVLARHLRRQGHRTFRSGVGANVGCTEDMVRRLTRRVEKVVTGEGRPVALVGHSRGGMLVKLVALRRPDLVESVVVLSAPVTGTLVVAAHVRRQLEWLFRLNARGLRRVIGQDCVTGDCAAQIAQELAAGMPADLPYTSIYSRLDGIIDWRTCLDPDAELVEVRSSHTAMAAHPKVGRIVAARLARATQESAAA